MAGPTTPSEALCVADCGAVLGEGPIWVAAEGELYWLDIKGLKIFRRDANGALSEWPTPFRVGSIVPRQGRGFVAGTERGFCFLEPGGDFDLFAQPEPERTTNRFNDGKVDRHGRFWAGTMDDTERAAAGALYRMGPDLAPVRVDDGYRVTNGPAFSRDGRLMYHTDSALRTIWAFALDDEGGATGKRVFAQFKGAEGYPDGMTVDSEDCLWVAFWDGWCVRRLSPAGQVIAEFPMPVERPTSVAFGGPALDQLFVTSARIGLNAEALIGQPQAGGLFMLKPGVAGIAELPFAGGDHR